MEITLLRDDSSHRKDEPIYDFPIKSKPQIKLKKPQQNEHYYSSVPDEICKEESTKLSFTIKMRPPIPKKPKISLQSDLSDLNKLTRQSREVAHSNEDILTSTSTSGFSQYKATKDFGDFQILTPVRHPKMVDV